MNLSFFVVNGPMKDQIFPIEAEFILGRSKGNIVLADPKISQEHAAVKKDSQGHLILVDLNSRNGIKINGKKVSSVKLIPGLRLRLGNSILEVQITEVPFSSPKQKDKKLPSSDNFNDDNQILVEFLLSKKKQIKNQPKTLSAFSPPVSLKFISGLQSDTNWVLGFGPRKLGARSNDLLLLEPQAPNICFELTPDSSGPLFNNFHPDIVLLNNRSLTNEVLKSGDVISIFNSQIKVEIDE